MKLFLDGLFNHERRTRSEYISAGWLSGRLPHGQAGLESRIVFMEKPVDTVGSTAEGSLLFRYIMSSLVKAMKSGLFR